MGLNGSNVSIDAFGVLSGAFGESLRCLPMEFSGICPLDSQWLPLCWFFSCYCICYLTYPSLDLCHHYCLCYPVLQSTKHLEQLYILTSLRRLVGQACWTWYPAWQLLWHFCWSWAQGRYWIHWGLGSYKWGRWYRPACLCWQLSLQCPYQYNWQ